MKHVNPSDQAVLRELKAGKTNSSVLKRIDEHYSQAIYRLRKLGYNIEATKVHSRLWKYELLEPTFFQRILNFFK